MASVQDLLERLGNLDPDALLDASLPDGGRVLATIARSDRPEDEVPFNPLPEQVNESGSGPEEIDGDAEDDDGQEGAEEGVNEIGSDVEATNDENVTTEEEDEDEDDSEYDEEPQRRVSKRVVVRKRPTATTTPAASTIPAPTMTPAPTTAPSKNVALATAIAASFYLPLCIIGAVEMLVFFPNHTAWPEVGLRFPRNGWTHIDMAMIKLWGRNTLARYALEKVVDARKHQVVQNGRRNFGVNTFTPSTHQYLMTPVTSYDASNYAPHNNNQALTHARLVDIARGVVNRPTGQDRGIVTQVIEYAVNHSAEELTTADIPRIAQREGFVAPTEAAGGNWDQNAKMRIPQIAGPVPARS